MSDTGPDPSPEEGAPEAPSRLRRLARRLGYAGLVVIVLVDVAVLAAIGLGTHKRVQEIASMQPSPTPVFALPSASPSVPSSPSRTRRCDQPVLIGTVAVDQVSARAAPDPKARVIEAFRKNNQLNSPQVFDLLKAVRAGGRTWYKALLPVRPNGTTGYVPGKALKVTYTTFRLQLERAKFRLTLFDGCDKVRSFPVGIGTGATPTPVGRFYLTGLFKPPDTTTVYGVSIYTLSGFSDVLTNWKLGGIIGLHGTNDPTSIGRNASHGCIRMRNRDILALEKLLPLGTPIVIR